MREAYVVAEDLGRTYTHNGARDVALVSATCTVSSGDRIALVGRSGSGKSTLLHLLGGLDAPTQGTDDLAPFGGRAHLRPRHIAFVFQSASLLPALTVQENVALPLLLDHIAPDTAQQSARAVLDRLALGDLAGKLPGRVVRGEAQRVGIARALAGQPRLILADEPTGQLDRTTADHLIDTLLGVLVDTDTALIVATHDERLANRMGCIWHMRDGRLDGEGTLHVDRPLV